VQQIGKLVNNAADAPEPVELAFLQI